MRCLVRVYVHMTLDRTRLGKPFVADGASIWTFTPMHLLVPYQMTVVAELFPTQTAAVDLSERCADFGLLRMTLVQASPIRCFIIFS